MRYSQNTLAIALYFSAYPALPATTVAQILHDLFNVSPSPDITKIWTKKAASCLYQELGQVVLLCFSLTLSFPSPLSEAPLSLSLVFYLIAG